MAFVLNDTTYAGTVEAGYMITQATFGLDTVRKGVAMVKGDIKKTHTIPYFDINPPLRPRLATPALPPSNNGVVNGVTLTPGKMSAFEVFDATTWEQHWYVEQQSPTLIARELPVTFENYLMQLMLNKSFQNIETALHMGSLGYTTSAASEAGANYSIHYFDGIIRKLLVNGNYIPATSPSAITSSNILAKFDDAILQVANNKKALMSDSDRFNKLKFLVSVQDYQLWQLASVALTFKGNQISDKPSSMYRGYEIVPLSGLPKDTFYFCYAMGTPDSNIWVGTNSMDDLMFKMGRLYDFSLEYYFRGDFAFDVNIAKPNEFFLHTTLTTSTFTA